MARQRRSGSRTNNRGNSRSNRRTGRRTANQRRTTTNRGSAPKRNRPNRRKSKSRLPLRDGLIWFGGGVGIGILLLLPLFLFTGDDEAPPPAEDPPAEPRPADPQPADPEPAEPEATSEPAPEAKDAPRAQKAPREDEGDGYRFYTLLPNMEVEVPSPPAEEPPSTEPEKEPARPQEPSSAAPRPTPAGEFLLQVASFQQADDAEAMKARLALRGLQAKVVDSDLGDRGTWYRVRLGPYAGRAQAEDVRDRLKRAGLRPMVMRQ